MDMKELAERYNTISNEYAERAITSVVVPYGNELLAEIKNRIAIDGKKTNEQQIGQYSTKSAYFGKEQFDKKGAFKGQGKVRKDTKTMYLPAGYKQLREIQGKEGGKINENYTGSTLFDYQLQAKQNEVVLGFVSERSSQIRKGQERKRGDIFYASANEIKQYKDNVIAGAGQLTINILRGD